MDDLTPAESDIVSFTLANQGFTRSNLPYFRFGKSPTDLTLNGHYTAAELQALLIALNVLQGYRNNRVIRR